MNKIKTFLPLFFLLIIGCGFKPILINNAGFSLNEIVISSDIIGYDQEESKINSIIKSRLELIQTIKKERNYNLNIINNFDKKIISKDSKGDPSIYEISINVVFEVFENEEILLTEKINLRNTYNNISDKFELEKYENIIIDNLSENIVNEIISNISNLNNDN